MNYHIVFMRNNQSHDGRGYKMDPKRVHKIQTCNVQSKEHDHLTSQNLREEKERSDTTVYGFGYHITCLCNFFLFTHLQLFCGFIPLYISQVFCLKIKINYITSNKETIMQGNT